MKRILIIEDDPDVSGMLQAILETEGYEVLLSENGKEGLSSLEENHPDLVILDIMMPVMDGIEFLEIKGSVPLYMNIPVIVHSALTDKKIRTRTIELGASHFIEKGRYDIDSFIRLVNEAL